MCPEVFGGLRRAISMFCEESAIAYIVVSDLFTLFHEPGSW
jgi:hypothetical protein